MDRRQALTRILGGTTGLVLVGSGGLTFAEIEPLAEPGTAEPGTAEPAPTEPATADPTTGPSGDPTAGPNADPTTGPSGAPGGDPTAVPEISPAAPADADSTGTLIRVIVPRDYDPPTDEAFQARLVDATVRFLEQRFQNQRLVYWRRKPRDIGFRKRLHWIIHWLSKGIDEARDVWPVDPVWMVAQIMQESFFYEFTISRALAAGVCQFIQPTAAEYGITVAGPHTEGKVERRDLAGKAEEYYELRAERRRFRRENRSRDRFDLEEALAVVGTADEKRRIQAQEQLSYFRDLDRYDERIRSAGKDYRRFLEANVTGRDIFDPGDAAFLERFDERFLYRKPVPAAALYIARNLRARRGNVIAAAAGYNAGLGRTMDEGIYSRYGRIPDIGETETYVSRILINHHEITTRLV